MVSSIALDGATVEVLPSETVDPAEARARIDAERGRLRAEIERARGKLANKGFTTRRRPSWCRPSARSSSASRPSWPSWSSSRGPRDERSRARGRALPALAGDVRHALRARAHAPADDGARLAPASASRRSTSSGTNGKSSTARMIAALLEAPRPAHRRLPVAAPALASPSGSRSGGGRVGDGALRRGGRSARPRPPRSSTARSSAGDRVTQFEALTAAAYWELAAAGVEVAVVEAGLGGRYDATSVIRSRVQVLTNVSLEHTRWLGPTERHIAEEKLAVVPDRRHAGRRAARPRGAARSRSGSPRSAARGSLRDRGRDVDDRRRRCELRRARAPSSARTSPSRVAAAEAFRGAARPARGARARPRSVRTAGPARGGRRATRSRSSTARTTRPARAALAGALRRRASAGRRAGRGDVGARRQGRGRRCSRRCCRAFDAGRVHALVATRRAAAGDAREPVRASSAGLPCEVEAEPAAALARARELAGPDGAVLVTGSIYLLSDLARAGDARRARP